MCSAFETLGDVFEFLAFENQGVIGIKEIDPPLKRRRDFGRVQNMNQCPVILILAQMTDGISCLGAVIGKFQKIAQHQNRMFATGVHVQALLGDAWWSGQHGMCQFFQMLGGCNPGTFYIKRANGFTISDQKVGQGNRYDKCAFGLAWNVACR